MQTLTFSCPHCTNLMAVGLELLGQQVQCPSCGKVVIAPPVNPDAQPMANTKGEVADGELILENPKEEDHESIFGETQDEDVFGSRPLTVVIPEGGMPATPNSGRRASQFAAFAPGMPPSAESTAPPEVHDSAPEPVPVPPQPEPEATPASWGPAQDSGAEPVPVSRESAGPSGDPWIPAPDGSNSGPSGNDAREPEFAADAHIEPVQMRLPSPTAEQRKGANLLLTILGPYSVIVTLLAGFYFYKARRAAEDEHPFKNIPDPVGMYEPAKRHQFTRVLEKMPSPDARLPDSLKVNLGATLRVGDLEVTPERVEQGKLREHTVAKNNQTSVQQLSGEALILHLRLKNVSSSLEFHPTDPYFDRYYDPHEKSAKPYTMLEVGGRKYYGGPINFLAIKWDQIKRKYIDGQENDDKPLPPGEERHTVICTDPTDEGGNQAVRAAGPSERLTWRVQLRHGLTVYKGNEYSVSAVVGVQFTPADIRKRN